jgi:hypothetical protein
MKTISYAVLVGVSTLALPAKASTHEASDETSPLRGLPSRDVDSRLAPQMLPLEGAETADRGENEPAPKKLKLRVETLRDLSLDLHFIGQKPGGDKRNDAHNRGVKKSMTQTIPDTTDVKVSPNTTSAPLPTIVYSGGIVGLTRSAPGSTASNYQPPAPPSSGPAGGPKPPAPGTDTDAPSGTKPGSGTGNVDRDRQGPGNNGGGSGTTSGGGGGGADSGRAGGGGSGGSKSGGSGDRDRQGPGNNGGGSGKTSGGGGGGADSGRAGGGGSGGSKSGGSGDRDRQGPGNNGGGSGKSGGGSGKTSGGGGADSGRAGGGGSGGSKSGGGGNRTGPQ